MLFEEALFCQARIYSLTESEGIFYLNISSFDPNRMQLIKGVTMPRLKALRTLQELPVVKGFRPLWMRPSYRSAVMMQLEEYEAIRLMDRVDWR